MSILENEVKKEQHRIAGHIKELFEDNMGRFDQDIPEVDHKLAAIEIHKVMQTILDMLKAEIDKGTYDNY